MQGSKSWVLAGKNLQFSALQGAQVDLQIGYIECLSWRLLPIFMLVVPVISGKAGGWKFQKLFAYRKISMCCAVLTNLSVHSSVEISSFSSLFYWVFLFTFLLKSLLSLHFSIEISTFSSLFYWHLYFLFSFLQLFSWYLPLWSLFHPATRTCPRTAPHPPHTSNLHCLCVERNHLQPTPPWAHQYKVSSNLQLLPQKTLWHQNLCETNATTIARRQETGPPRTRPGTAPHMAQSNLHPFKPTLSLRFPTLLAIFFSK